MRKNEGLIFHRRFLGITWLHRSFPNMLLLTNCELHTGKDSDRSLDVRTERKTKVRKFSRMDRTNWSIELYCNTNDSY